MKKYILLMILFAVLSIAQTSYGMATEQIGPNSDLTSPPLLPLRARFQQP